MVNRPEHGQRLLWHGLYLFLLGLLSGFAVPALRNPRMGLSAQAWQENLVDFGLISLAVAMVAACVLALWGLRHGSPGAE